MKKLFWFTTVATVALYPVFATADTSSISTTTTGMGVLENDYVKAGVNKDTGTFGSGGNTSPGLLFDSLGTGTFNTSYDYLTPGSPFDGWSIKIDGTNYTNNNASTGGETWTDSDGLSDGDGTLTWQGTNSDLSGWQVEHIYSLGATSQYIDIETNITAGSSASDSTVYFGRFIDPDARAADGDSSATDNVLGYSGIPDTNVAFSEATTSRYALGLYSTNDNVDAGITGWTTDADSYTTSKYTDSDGNTVNYGTGDDTIGLTWVWTGVEAGDILTADYSYIFGPSAFDAADEAIDGGAGGGTAGETPSSWGSVEDVGSATDAASGSATVTGTATSSLTRHTVSDDGEVQTVDRTKTTSTWDVYSDGTTGTASATTETLPTFSARVDQYSIMDTISTGINKTFVVTPWKEGGISQAKTTVYLNGNYGTVNTDNYDAKIMGTGITTLLALKDDWKVGISFDRIQLTIDNTDSDNKMSKTHVGLSNILENENFIFATDLNFSYNEYEVNRRVYIWENNSDTKGYDAWASQRVYIKLSDNLTPYLGGSIGRFTRDEVIEEGYFLSSRTINKKKETSKYGELGVRANYSIYGADVFGQASYSTDKWLSADAGISYDMTENSSISILASRLQHDDVDINKVMLRGSLNF